VLQAMARELRARGVTRVVMEASGIYTDPVYYALCEQDFDEVAVVNPAHVKALRGHKTDAADCRRLAELFECGLLHGSYIPPAELKEVRDLTRYRMKTVQARTSEIQRLGKALESAGIKPGSVASEITGASATAMIEALTGGERRGQVLADLARGRMRTAGKRADLSMALTGRFTEHHALLCRLHRDRITLFDDAASGSPRRARARRRPGRARGRRGCAAPNATTAGPWPRPGRPTATAGRRARRECAPAGPTTAARPGSRTRRRPSRPGSASTSRGRVPAARWRRTRPCATLR
jgi:hypothetical protein